MHGDTEGRLVNDSIYNINESQSQYFKQSAANELINDSNSIN